MRIDEIIARADSLEPNQYSVDDKLQWINQLDGKIFEEVISTHYDVPLRFRPPVNNTSDGEAAEHYAEDSFSPEEYPGTVIPVWKPYESIEESPIVDRPYGMDVYVYYLQAMVAQSNMENAKFNARMVAFNAAYREFTAWYNRTHRPRLPKGGNRLRF